jgi:hypothetical protein
MEYVVGENVFAVWNGEEWVMKPVCSPDNISAGGNCFAVKTPDEWVVNPASVAEVNENAVTVKDPAGNKLLWPIGCDCEEEEGGCSGTDPYCSYCDCSNYLRSSYTVSLSGFPAVCTAESLNGTWTLDWTADCVWRCDVTSSHHLQLSLNTPWVLSWTIDGGVGGGGFSPSAGEGCKPETYAWTPDDCAVLFWCNQICTSFSSCTCVIT